jgi:hypothetical protein
MVVYDTNRKALRRFLALHGLGSLAFLKGLNFFITKFIGLSPNIEI